MTPEEEIVKTWRCGEEAMRQRILMQIKHHRWMAEHGAGPLDLDDLVKRIEALPLMEMKK